MTPPPLLASCWTTAGDAAPQRGDEISPFALADRVRATAEAGWAGFGLLHADLVDYTSRYSLADLSRLFRVHGIDAIELEFLGDWWRDGEIRSRSDIARGELLAAAAELGAARIKVAGSFSPLQPGELERMADEFAALCDEAQRAGTVIGLEAMPFTNFGTVGAASDFVASVGHRHGGLFLDIWHVFRAGTSLDELQHVIDPEYLVAVELNDAFEPAPAGDDLWADTVDARQLPGDGHWDLPRAINILRDLGYEGPWGVEVLSAEHRARSLDDAVTRAFQSAAEVFADADRARERIVAGHP